MSPSWRPQPISCLDIWALICHSQQRPSHFALSLKWGLLSFQVSEDRFIIPALCSGGARDTYAKKALGSLNPQQPLWEPVSLFMSIFILLLFHHIPLIYWVMVDECVCVCVRCFSPRCPKRTNYGCLCSLNACKRQERNIAPLTI